MMQRPPKANCYARLLVLRCGWTRSVLLLVPPTMEILCARILKNADFLQGGGTLRVMQLVGTCYGFGVLRIGTAECLVQSQGWVI